MGTMSIAQNVLTLRDCITYAVTNSLDLGDYTLQLEDSNEDVRNERHNFLPSISMELNNSFSTGFQQVFTKDVAGTYQSVSSYNNAVTFYISLPIWADSAQRTLIRLKRKSSDVIAQKKADCEQSLKLDVIERFYALALAKLRQQQAEEQLALQDSVLSVSQRMYEVGQRAYKDVVDAKYNLENDRQNLMGEEQNVLLALRKLKRVMNYKVDMDIKIENEANDTIMVLSFNELEQLAFQHSPSLCLAELQIVNASLKKKTISRQRYPSITFNLQAGTSGQQLFNFPNDKMTNQWHHNAYHVASLTLQIPIFNRLNVRSQLRKADIAVLRMQTALEKERTELRHELQMLYQDIQQCNRQIPQKECLEKLAREQYNLAIKDYTRGNIPSYSLNAYKNKWMIASLSLAQAYIESRYKKQVLNVLIN